MMMLASRDLASKATYYLPNHPRVREQLCVFATAYPIIVMHHLRKESNLIDENHPCLVGLLTEAEIQALVAASNKPLFLLDMCRAAVVNAIAPNTPPGQYELFPPRIRVEMLRDLNRVIDNMGLTTGSMERIQGQPLPLIFVTLLRSVITIYVVTFPVVQFDSLGWGAIPATIVLSLVLFMIESSAIECEAPFGKMPNHLPMERYAQMIGADVLQIMRMEPFARFKSPVSNT
eukprot:c20321_g5_i2.p1 GENE.c20321_g5_i2~~c20321_g5_i2.p1  ORF type:complete len:232 (+),score=47.42 c20321_g5_i2:743-1438(+)